MVAEKSDEYHARLLRYLTYSYTERTYTCRNIGTYVKHKLLNLENS
jgi:hypothetical protein